MSNLEVAAICTAPLWLLAADLAFRDTITAWYARYQRNREIRAARRQLRQVTRIDAWQRRNYEDARKVTGGAS